MWALAAFGFYVAGVLSVVVLMVVLAKNWLSGKW